MLETEVDVLAQQLQLLKNLKEELAGELSK